MTKNKYKKREKTRNRNIIDSGYKVIHISESDYKNNKEEGRKFDGCGHFGFVGKYHIGVAAIEESTWSE